MGRWDESIYGGDDSLKLKEKIYEICEVEEYGDDNKVQHIPIQILKEKIISIRNMIDNSKENDDYKNIGYQVFGSILMHSGFNFDKNNSLKEKIIKSIENDEWAKERPLRRIVLNNFKKIINEYEFNNPIDIEKENLFEECDDIEGDEDIAKEFKEVIGLINSRIKKIKSNINEKSGNEEYDDGYSVAAEEGIDFLTDFKELISKQELMGILLEKISKGLDSSLIKENNNKSTSIISNEKTNAGRADVQPG